MKSKTMNDETIRDTDRLSLCCSAPMYSNTDICSDCKEHSGVIKEEKSDEIEIDEGGEELDEEKIADAIDTEDLGAKADYAYAREKDERLGL